MWVWAVKSSRVSPRATYCSPKRRLRECCDMQVTTMSPAPPSPMQVSASPPAATTMRLISASPRVMSMAAVLSPKPMP